MAVAPAGVSMPRLAPIAGLFLLAAFSRPAAAQAPPEIRSITLARLGCYWMCPRYTVTLHPDGTFDYNGAGEVPKMYQAQGRFPKRKFEALSRAVQAMDFFSMPQGPFCSQCDDEKALIRIETATESRTLYFHWYGRPNALTQLGRAINRAANLRSLVGRYY